MIGRISRLNSTGRGWAASGIVARNRKIKRLTPLCYSYSGRLVSNSEEWEDLKLMKHGAVIIDVAVDQGGCVETTRPTTHSSPTYVVEGIVHYCVTNMPGAVGRTSTHALCNVTLPYVQRLAHHGLNGAASLDPGFANAINMHQGLVTNKPVADTFHLPFSQFQA